LEKYRTLNLEPNPGSSKAPYDFSGRLFLL
ncbi:MAG: hypothetical protein ACI8SK_001274, partial [Shewanella sp.]